MLRIRRHFLSTFASPPSFNQNVLHVMRLRCTKDGGGDGTIIKRATFASTVTERKDDDNGQEHTDTNNSHIRANRHAGLGRLVATSFDNGKSTQCTTVAHKSPVRLIPLRSTQVLAQGGCHGILIELRWWTTPRQSHPKQQPTCSTIGKQQQEERLLSETNFTARVDPNGLLVMAPDPVTPFASSAYRQIETIVLHPTSSLCFIDWFSSGRFANGEHWQQERLETCTTIYLEDDTDLPTPQGPTQPLPRQLGNKDQVGVKRNRHDETNSKHRCQPFLVESISLMDGPYRNGMDWGDQLQCNAFVTVFLYGSQIQLVQKRFQQLQEFFLSKHTRVRQNTNSGSMKQGQEKQQQELLGNLQNTISGNRVLLSVSNVDHAMRLPHMTPSTTLSVVRIAAMSNEDLYRILHYCLQPLAIGTTSKRNDFETLKSPRLFGLEFYKDRIHSTRSPVTFPTATVPTNQHQTTTEETIRHHQKQRPQQQLQQPPKHQQRSQIWNDTRIQPHTFLSPSQETTYSDWAMLLLADSSLPTGGFAHSSGLEAAAQLGMLSNRQQVHTFVKTSVQSFLHLSSPVVHRVHNHALTAINSYNKALEEDYLSSYAQKIDILNYRYHLAIVSNEPACMASLDQGRSLLRVAVHWAQDQAQTDSGSPSHISQKEDVVKGIRCRRGLDLLYALNNQDEFHPGFHYPTVFALTSAVLGVTRMEQTELLMGYCAARDLVSAAVRLNLIGPLSSVTLLASIDEFIAAIASPRGNWNRVGCIRDNDNDNISGDDDLVVLSSCAPVLDAIQPCHNALAVRLFRS